LKGLPKIVGKNHCVSSFLGTNAATTKIAITRALNGSDFYPIAFCLPKERNLLNAFLEKFSNTYWILKPRNGYAGMGCRVFNSYQESFKKLIAVDKGTEFVVQRYIRNPFLISGYKFHFRMYAILSGIDPFRAYLLRDGHVLFSTKPYTLANSTLGEKFDKFIHLTN